MYDSVIFTDVTDTVTIYKAIGAYKIANILRQQGYSCLVVDHLHSFTLEEIKRVIDNSVSNNTLFVGFSTTFFNSIIDAKQPDGSLRYNLILSGVTPQGIDYETEVVQYIKSISPNCKIVVGGTKAHGNINNKNINYSVMGYGEASIINLANHLRHGTNLTHSYKNLYGTIVIDNKTSENYDFVNSTFAWTKLDVGGARVLPLEIARGCIFKCKFCSYPLNGKQNLDFIRHADNLYQELQNNYDHFGVEDYSILDDTFNDNEYKLDILLSVINKLSFRPKFWAYTRLDLIAQKPALVDKLYDIGLRALFFGIETLNKRTGLIIGKGFDKAKQIDTIQRMRNRFGNSVLMHGSFILGLPEESIDSMNETFEQLMDNTIPLHSFLFNGLHLYKNEFVAFNSELSKNYQDYGYSIISDSDSPKINWKNGDIDYNTVVELATRFNMEAQLSDRLHLQNQTAFSLKNLNYSDEYISNVKFNEVNWTEVGNKKDQHIKNYKELLFKGI